jgi:DNA polymerase-3 subunit epsilon
MALRPIYYDTETTGIRHDKDRIIELAAYDPYRDKSFCKLINPKQPIPAEATAIHKITDEMVADAPTFDEIIPEFLEFCEGDTVLIAHNNDAFDLLFIRAEFGRSSIAMPNWTFLDTLKWARKYRPDLPRHSLQFLREIYGFPANNAHRALDDVIVLHQVFSVMIDDLPLETALSLLKTPAKVNSMPFGKHQGKPLDKVPKDYVAWLDKTGAFEKAENSPLRDAFQKLGFIN